MKKVVLLVILIVMSASVIYADTRQGNWIWRFDNGTESEATSIADENNAFTLSDYNNIRLRVELYNEDPNFTSNKTLSLFYSTQPFPYTNDWTKITADDTTNAFVLSLSDNFEDGDIAPTDLLSQSFGNHAAGVMTESSSDRVIPVAANSSQEYEYCIKATPNIALNSPYYFTIREPDGTSITWYSTSNDLPNLFTVAVPLPVELTLFTGNALNNSVRLLWNTATEVNNYGFEIERRMVPLNSSQGGTSEVILGEGWGTAGFVNGNGNSNSIKEYEYTDKNLPAGKYLYRLKQIDNDGSFEYSDEIEVEVADQMEFNLVQNYPNPFNPETTIEFTLPESGMATLKVFNILGEEIATLFNEFAEAGKYYDVKFNASSFPSGMYIARLQSGDPTNGTSKQMIKKMQLLK